MDETVRCEATVKASPSRVFEAFVEIKDLLNWFADGVLVGKREGGNWALGWYADDDSNLGYHMMGTISTYDPGKELVVDGLRFTTPEGNEFGPMKLSISFHDGTSAGTVVTVVQEGIQAHPAWDEYRSGILPGWQRTLDQLRGWIEDGRKLAGR